MFFKDLLDLSKVPAQFIAAVATASAFAVFFPAEWIPQLALNEFKLSEYGKFTGVLCLLTTGITAFSAVAWVIRTVNNKITTKRQKNEYESRILSALTSIDKSETGVLREYGLQKSRTLAVPVNDPAIGALMKKGVLEMVSTFENSDHEYIYASVGISHYAESILRLEYIDITPNMEGKHYVTLTSEERPHWARNSFIHADLRQKTKLIS